MQSSELMLDGLNLMLYGMGFVFTFLTLLVFSTRGMSAVITKWFPAPEPVAIKPMAANPGLTQAQLAANDPQLIAVLTAAVHRYRQDR
ncbi:MAG: OadG family protein [Gammaproteobacteria bacterium]|nr:OadG family protein [Gammaproteobacteria bacterium]